MRCLRRLLTLLAVFTLVAALGATTVLAKDHIVAVNGSSSGMTRNTNGCDPSAPHPTLLLCTFDVHGTYHATGIGSGSYSGKTQIDYAQYGSAGPDPNGGGACTPVTGKITFRQSEDDTLTTTLGPGSKVCETNPPSAVHHTYLVLTITGGTGRFHGATGTINSNGETTDVSASQHKDSATLTGSVTLHNGHDDGGDDNHGHDDGGDGGNND